MHLATVRNVQYNVRYDESNKQSDGRVTSKMFTLYIIYYQIGIVDMLVSLASRRALRTRDDISHWKKRSLD